MGWMELVDNKLEKLFSSKPDNSAKVLERRRNKTLEGLDKAAAAHKSGADAHKGWFSKKGDVARFWLRSGNKVVQLNGKDYNHCPSERLGDVYGDLRQEIAAGKHDQAITAAYPVLNHSASGERNLSDRPKRQMSPEHRAKIAEATRARHAARKALESK